MIATKCRKRGKRRKAFDAEFLRRAVISLPVDTGRNKYTNPVSIDGEQAKKTGGGRS